MQPPDAVGLVPLACNLAISSVVHQTVYSRHTILSVKAGKRDDGSSPVMEHSFRARGNHRFFDILLYQAVLRA